MSHIFLGIAILLGLWLAARWYVSAQPVTVIRVLRWTAAILGIGLIIAVALTKQISWLFFAIPVLLPWLMRARSAARMARNWQRMSGAAGQSAAGQSSQVETGYLRMNLDHATGGMDGEVLQGQYRGRTLSNLSLKELLALLCECSNDEKSQQVLAAYLERTHPDWRDAAQARDSATSSGNGVMSREEAYKILELKPGATSKDIKEAHHRLMTKIHPDTGGSTYLATKINQAKDMLLGG